ncbi:odorant receptor 67c-like [Arctopsyche grandis]|uniref:odorant receptor 67c-like n=1 Tax=Arctopsyche grandis TaxID=121162 RepID=UPI00406D8000
MRISRLLSQFWTQDGNLWYSIDESLKVDIFIYSTKDSYPPSLLYTLSKYIYVHMISVVPMNVCIEYLLFLTASVIVPETIYVWSKSGGFIDKTRTMGPILGIGTFTMKYMILSTKRVEFKQLIDKLQEALVRCNKCHVKSSKYVCEHDALEQLKICIKQHNVVIKYVGDFEKLFSWQLFVDFNLSAAKICLFLFQAIDNISETNQLIAFIGFAVGSWLQLFMISRFGQQIITESSDIADAAFGCAWFMYGKEFRKLVILIIQRAQKPLGLTAGKFFYISMESFSKISSATTSYFMLLRAVREN